MFYVPYKGFRCKNLREPPVIVSLDVGTSSVKVSLISLEGGIVRWASQHVEMASPEPGAAEHELEALYRALLKGLESVVRGYENRVEALTFSCYLHGIALLNGERKPVTNVFTHLDTRLVGTKVL